MKQSYRVVVSLSLVLGMSILTGQSSLGYAKPNGGFITDYPVVKNPEHEIWRSTLKNNNFLEQIANVLNQLVAIPGVVTIEARECGQVNAFYRPGSGPLAELVMCYELLDDFQQVFSPYYPDSKLRGQMIMGAWMFVFMHELGHALANQLDLPISGKEEDAVDQLSTLILTNVGASGETAVMAGAQWFRLGSARYRASGPAWLQNVFGNEHYNFSDEHSISEQRFYNLLCWEYGYNPEALAGAVKDGTLPAERAQRCGHEYRQIVRTWEQLLAPHAKTKPPLFKSVNNVSAN